MTSWRTASAMANPAPLTPPSRPRWLGWTPCLPLAMAPLLLTGCSQVTPPEDPTALLPPPPPPAPAAAGKPPAAVTVGLEPLATPQQVINSVDLGRRDPFGRILPALPSLVGPDGKPLPPGAMAAAMAAARGAQGPVGAATPAGAAAGDSRSGRVKAPPRPPLQLPPGFSISGVIRSGGVSEAVVSYGPLSGSLRPGDRGGRTTVLLPSGWSVASVDVNRGTLTLQKDGQRVSAEL